MRSLYLFRTNITERLVVAFSMSDARKVLREEYGNTSEVRNAKITKARGPFYACVAGYDDETFKLSGKEARRAWCGERDRGFVPQY